MSEGREPAIRARIGTTSITFHVDLEAEIVYVNVDESGRHCPISPP